MVLDIDLFREEKGGNVELIRTSQRNRFKGIELVDKVINLDKDWRKGTFKISSTKFKFYF